VRFVRHFLRWTGAILGVPLGVTVLVGVIPGLQLLVILPFALLVTPPAMVFGRPHFQWTELGYLPQSGPALLLALGFWLAVCLVLAAITVLLTDPPPPQELKPRAEAPATRNTPAPAKRAPLPVEVVMCPQCRATNSPAAACSRCGAPLQP
jgi:hypothetical protein